MIFVIQSITILRVIQIKKLIWDEWNIEHITRHGVTKAGRTLAVVLHPKTKDAYYVVTARIADRKERRIYQTEIQKGGEQAA